MNYVTGTLAVVLLIAIAAFSFQNRDPVDVTFFLWSLSMPKVFLILGTFLLGMLAGWGLLTVVKKALR
jgi:uncharacterized integral membrane protein